MASFRGSTYVKTINIVAECTKDSALCLAFSLFINCLLQGSSQGLELLRYPTEFPSESKPLFLLTLLFCSITSWFLCTHAVQRTWETSRESSKDTRSVSEYLVAFPYVVTLTFLAPFLLHRFSNPGVAALIILSVLLAAWVALYNIYLNGGLAALWRLLAAPVHAAAKKRRTRSIASFLTIVSIVGGSLCVFKPVWVPRLLGPLGTIYFLSTVWLLLLTLLFQWIPRKLNISYYFLPAIALVLFWVSSYRANNHGLRTIAPQSNFTSSRNVDDERQKQARSMDTEYTKNWLTAHCESLKTDPTKPCPVIFVAAEGGGIRAAYWAASVMDAVDRASYGAFNAHLFAVSGVSGGGIGSAAYLLEHRCTPFGYGGDELFEFLSDDYLSPLLAGLLTRDIFQHFIPLSLHIRDRSAVFEQSLEDSWKATLHNDQMSRGIRELFAQDISDRNSPALFINTTNVETGKRYLISNINLPVDRRGDEYFAFDERRLTSFEDIPLSASISAGARFPLASPAAVVFGSPTPRAINTWHFNGPPPNTVVWGNIVDGGYFENSGLATLRDALGAFQCALKELNQKATSESQRIRVQVVVLVITDDPSPAELPFFNNLDPDAPSRPMEPADNRMMIYRSPFAGDRILRETEVWTTTEPNLELLYPLRALLNTRIARASYEKAQLAAQLRGIRDDDLASCNLLHEQQKRSACQPSFSMEEFSLAHMLFMSHLVPLGHGYLSRSEDEYRTLLQQIDGPGLGWALSDKSIETMDHFSQALQEPEISGLFTSGVTRCVLDKYLGRGGSEIRCDQAELAWRGGRPNASR